MKNNNKSNAETKTGGENEQNIQHMPSCNQTDKYIYSCLFFSFINYYLCDAMRIYLSMIAMDCLMLVQVFQRRMIQRDLHR